MRRALRRRGSALPGLSELAPAPEAAQERAGVGHPRPARAECPESSQPLVEVESAIGRSDSVPSGVGVGVGVGAPKAPHRPSAPSPTRGGGLRRRTPNRSARPVPSAHRPTIPDDPSGPAGAVAGYLPAGLFRGGGGEGEEGIGGR